VILSAGQILNLHRSESDRLELKASLEDPSLSQVVRTVCAFANDLQNLNGGYVLIGIEADPDTGGPSRVRGVDAPDQAQQRLVQALTSIQPEYTPRIATEHVDGKAVLVLHCPAGTNRPYSAPDDVRGKGARHSYVRQASITKRAHGELLRSLEEQAARTPFDDRRRDDASIDDLSLARVRRYLERIGSALLEQDLEPADLYRRLDLTRPVNGHEVPRNVALLFFALDPERWFPGAKVEVASFPDGKGGNVVGERTFSGPLDAQLEQVVEHVYQLAGLRIEKHPDRTEAEHLRPYPRAALEEALANALYHRSYELQEPTKVDLLPDRVRVTSYPGPIAGGRQALEGAPPRARNRRIGELFRQLRLAEARGTGLPKIRRALERHGSAPPTYEVRDDVFAIDIPAHPAFRPLPAGQPLRLGSPAPPDELRGRDELLDALTRRVALQDVVLFGLPGVGRTSVLNALKARMGDRITVVDDDTSEGPPVADGSRQRTVIVREEPVDWRGWTNVQVPPLEATRAREWTLALAAGAGAPRDVLDAFADAVDARAWGVPGIVAPLVAECVVRGRYAPTDVELAYGRLQTDPTDPAGLKRRRSTALSSWCWTPISQNLFLIIRDAGRTGLPVEELGEHGWTREQAAAALHQLCLTGVVVEVDGCFRLEHPTLADADRNVEPAY
jgi:predicted HTH transcriptional regulator